MKTDKTKKVEEKKQVKKETEQMNYMKDIAKNNVPKLHIEQARENRMKDLERTNPAKKSPRNGEKTKREAKSMVPTLRNLRPSTAQPP